MVLSFFVLSLSVHVSSVLSVFEIARRLCGSITTCDYYNANILAHSQQTLGSGRLEGTPSNNQSMRWFTRNAASKSQGVHFRRSVSIVLDPREGNKNRTQRQMQAFEVFNAIERVCTQRSVKNLYNALV